jgi:nicotinamidase-related amidase
MSTFMQSDDTALLLIDHQSGLFQTVKDKDVRQLRTNVAALAKMAKLLSLPVIITASVPEGPNGPLVPEIAKIVPDAKFVARKGEVNAWDTPAFPEAVRATGKHNLVIAGVWTSVCVAFPALAARAEGYSVYAVIDASGDVSVAAQQVTVARLAQAGVIPTTTNSVVAELQKTWSRPDALEFGSIYASIAPVYAAVIESHLAAAALSMAGENRPLANPNG